MLIIPAGFGKCAPARPSRPNDQIVGLRRNLCSWWREHVRLGGFDAITEHEFLVTREARDT